jgi:hemerythrin superfamily protein
MNIYSVLKEDHKKVGKLLDQLVASSEADTEDWKSLVQQISDELIPHARAEEAVFYNPIRETIHGKGLIAHSYAEHAVAEAELRALQAMEKINVNWIALARKLKADLTHHVEEEETKVFAAGKKVFTDEEAEQIGTAFQKLKPAIQKEDFSETSRDFISNLLPKWMRHQYFSAGNTHHTK